MYTITTLWNDVNAMVFYAVFNKPPVQPIAWCSFAFATAFSLACWLLLLYVVATTQIWTAQPPGPAPFRPHGIIEATWAHSKNTFSATQPPWLWHTVWWLLFFALGPLVWVPWLIHSCRRSKMEAQPPISKGKAKKQDDKPAKAEKMPPWPAVAFIFWTLALGIFVAAESHNPAYHPAWFNQLIKLAPVWLILTSFTLGLAVACVDWTRELAPAAAAAAAEATKAKKLGKRGVVAKGDLIQLSKGHTGRVMHLTVELVEPAAAAK